MPTGKPKAANGPPNATKSAPTVVPAKGPASAIRLLKQNIMSWSKVAVCTQNLGYWAYISLVIFTSRVSGRGNIFGSVRVCVKSGGLVSIFPVTLCITTMVYGGLVHHQAAICTTKPQCAQVFFIRMKNWWCQRCPHTVASSTEGTHVRVGDKSPESVRLSDIIKSLVM